MLLTEQSAAPSSGSSVVVRCSFPGPLRLQGHGYSLVVFGFGWTQRRAICEEEQFTFPLMWDVSICVSVSHSEAVCSAVSQTGRTRGFSVINQCSALRQTSEKACDYVWNLFSTAWRLSPISAKACPSPLKGVRWSGGQPWFTDSGLHVNSPSWAPGVLIFLTCCTCPWRAFSVWSTMQSPWCIIFIKKKFFLQFMSKCILFSVNLF